jgi:DNA polymerase-3 subunit delta
MDSLIFLERAGGLTARPVYALHGDEEFLKRQVLLALRKLVLESDDQAFGLSSYAGDKAVFATVRDELETLPFLSPRRLVVVENADPFVSRFRPELEKYVGSPSAQGVLVLDVKTLASNTRLAKLLEGDASLLCKSPPAHKLADWCIQWARASHAKQLVNLAARLLVDLVGPDMGLLDQELNKLAIYVGTRARIDTEDVDRLVGSSRAETMWKIFSAIGAGNSKDALSILDRLLNQGEEPLRILGAFSMQLRRLVKVARLNQQGQTLGRAMERAGVPPFGQRDCEQQLRHLGSGGIDHIYDWLLEVDAGLKGGSHLEPRTLLERLVIQLANQHPA